MSERSPMAPHTCPAKDCGAAAYLPFGMQARCTSRKCAFYDRELWVEHVMSLPDEGDPPQLDLFEDSDGTATDYLFKWDDEDTQPQVPSHSPSPWTRLRALKNLGIPTLDDHVASAPIPVWPSPLDGKGED